MSMADRDGLIWLDGQMVPWRDATTHVLTYTLHYGVGVFEGVRAYATQDGRTCIFRLGAHTDRLFRSAHILMIEIPYTAAELNAAQKQVIVANNLQECYLRPMCYLTSDSMGLRAENLVVHTMIATWEWPAYMDPKGLETGIRVRTSSYTRHHVNISMCKSKANGHYINSTLAKREAQLHLIAPISVPIQGLHLVRKPYTLLIYQGVWGLYLLYSKTAAPIVTVISADQCEQWLGNFSAYQSSFSSMAAALDGTEGFPLLMTNQE